MNRRSVLGLPGGLTMLNINTDLASAYGRRRRDRTSFDSIEYDNVQLLDYQHPAPQAHQDPDQEIDLLNDDSNLPLPPWIPPPPMPPQPVYKPAGQQQQMKGTTPLRVLNVVGYTDGENKLFYPACAYKCEERVPEKFCDPTSMSCVCTNAKLLGDLEVCVKLECVHYGGDMEKFWRVMGRDCGRIGLDLDRKSTPELKDIYGDAGNTPINPPTSPWYGDSYRQGTSWATSPSTPRLGAFFSSTPTTPRPGTSFTNSPSTPRANAPWGAGSPIPRPGTSFTNSPSTPRPGTSSTNSPSTPRVGTSFTSSPSTPRPGTAFSLLSRDTSIGSVLEDQPLTITVTKTVSVEIEPATEANMVDSIDYRTICNICFFEPGSERMGSRGSSDKSVNYPEEEKVEEKREREQSRTTMPRVPEETHAPNSGVAGLEKKAEPDLVININTNCNEAVEFLKKFGMTPKKVAGAVKKVRNMFGRVQT
ncbi:hypothetical protein TWF730_000198 [Orbilia blumenaviensis]|uniref:CFEM domain-containing protein n=1 Tax=Orbilia blumenaviensis TaxID=1796055 RepID=A0AAV9VL56_9PEZI